MERTNTSLGSNNNHRKKEKSCFIQKINTKKQYI